MSTTLRAISLCHRSARMVCTKCGMVGADVRRIGMSGRSDLRLRRLKHPDVTNGLDP
jgi:hypothetical protein